MLSYQVDSLTNVTKYEILDHVVEVEMCSTKLFSWIEAAYGKPVMEIFSIGISV